MNKHNTNKKILWIVEYKDFEIDYVKSISSKILNADITVVAIRYWLFLPNMQKFDLIVIPFLPSTPSPNASLIKSALKSGINVIVLNWWQSFSNSELEYRRASLEYFTKLPIHFFSIRKSYSKYLCDMGFKSNIIDSEYNLYNLTNVDTGNQRNKKQKTNVFFLIDFDYAFANNELQSYRLNTGYDKNSLNNRISFSKDFLKVFVKDILNFAKKNPLINIKIGR